MGRKTFPGTTAVRFYSTSERNWAQLQIQGKVGVYSQAAG